MKEFADFALDLARASGELIRGYYRRPIGVESKADASPVTEADREAERLMRAMIEKRYPDHGVLGEEFGSLRPEADRVWVLDPIDGTKSFIAGVPLFATLIALVERGEPVLGIIHQPILGQLLLGTPEGTTLDGEPCRVRRCARVEDATLLTTDILDVERHQDWARFHALARRVKLLRGWGDAYGYFLVATGYADAMCDPVMNPWDIMALVPVIRGAGGKITDWRGGDPARGASIVATGGEPLHGEVIRALNG
ncbi:MAG: histidinol-phosphatase [Candidatus Methylomirabilis sp.]|nr:histidinol-phosphatase [Deltaproteobacteria bacterium]